MDNRPSTSTTAVTLILQLSTAPKAHHGLLKAKAHHCLAINPKPTTNEQRLAAGHQVSAITSVQAYQRGRDTPAARLAASSARTREVQPSAQAVTQAGRCLRRKVKGVLRGNPRPLFGQNLIGQLHGVARLLVGKRLKLELHGVADAATGCSHAHGRRSSLRPLRLRLPRSGCPIGLRAGCAGLSPARA